MKKIKFLVYLISFYFFFNNSFSQVIVFADINKIIRNSDTGQKIFAHFEKKNNELQKKK